MNLVLDPVEARVLGALIEKELTTPDYYPLTLNALINACNQKSNREPIMSLDEGIVQDTLDSLSKKHLVWEKSTSGSRVPKYAHRFHKMFELSPEELGILCVLLLRGPQTPGELRTRTNRLCEFQDLGEVEATLRHLMERDDGPYVVQLPRRSGSRESRFAHLFSGEVAFEEETASAVEGPSRAPPRDEARLTALEDEVAALRAALDDLRRRFEEWTQRS